MVSMPYMFQKGPAWQLLEEHLSLSGPDRIVRKKEMLAFLRDAAEPAKAKFTTNSGTASPNQGTDTDLNNRVAGFQQNWYGEDDAGNFDGAQSPGTPHKTPRVGWWVNWYGKPSAIVTEALIRAIEISLGVTHGAVLPADDNFSRDWPIEFVWVCPVGWFQAGISWRDLPPKATAPRDESGLVTVTWLTPGNAPADAERADCEQGPEMMSPDANHGLFWTLDHDQRGGETGNADLDLDKNPTDSSAARGHWIVGHPVTTPYRYRGTYTNGQGTWADVLPSAVSTVHDVVTVRPAWNDGGVNPTRNY